ncbi:MAG TPA: hypothetical protein VMZ74_11895 [Ramlibacter sp.]|nr:hypothetical protein [Ramlibacter sp.]
MKATALIAAAVLACGTAAYAQQPTDPSARGEENARVDQQDHGQANAKMRNGAHRLGDKVRHGWNRLTDKTRQVAHNDRRHHHANDTRAMGASRDTRDVESTRHQRMDDAYASWKAKHDKDERR